MNQDTREKWNHIYRHKTDTETHAAQVLAEHTYLLPQTGHALDVACGRGGNALLLARHGLQTQAWDISDTAITALDKLSEEKNVSLQALQRDVNAEPPDANSFAVIVVSRFLERDLLTILSQALTPQGLLFYQTFIQEKTTDIGPRNPDFLLKPNELLQAFSDLHIIYYEENGQLGEQNQGHRNEALLIAQKRE